MDLNGVAQATVATLVAVGWKIVGAAAGLVLCVRAYCKNEHYWQVYVDTNRSIREAFSEAGFPGPVPVYAVSGLGLQR